MIVWMIGIVLVTAIVFNAGNLNANVAKSGIAITKEPVLRVLNPDASAGSNLIVKVNNIKSLTSSRIQIFDSSGRYSGVSFPIGRGDCTFASAGYYDCQTTFNIPHSILPNGKYYLQVKSDASSKFIGNKAFFTIENSQYQETGR